MAIEASLSSAQSHEDAAEAVEGLEDGTGTAQDESALDAEAEALLADLSNSQAEVQAMIDQHKKQTAELGGLRDNLASELEELQQERWKLELYGELEVLKRQLESLKTLEQDLDASEALLEATEPDGSPNRLLPAPSGDNASHLTANGQPSDLGATTMRSTPHANGTEAGANDDDDDEEEYDPEAIAEMQAKLDQDLAEMFAQLQAVKFEAATVSAQKARLEAELRALQEDQELAGWLAREEGVGEGGGEEA